MGHNRLSGTPLAGWSYGGVREQRVQFGIFFGDEETDKVGPGGGIPLVEILPCLKIYLMGGEYPVTVVSAELVDAETGWAIHPRASAEPIVLEETLVDPGQGCPDLEDFPLPEGCRKPPVEPPPLGADFLRGDANADGRLSISDALLIHRYPSISGRASLYPQAVPPGSTRLLTGLAAMQTGPSKGDKRVPRR